LKTKLIDWPKRLTKTEKKLKLPKRNLPSRPVNKLRKTSKKQSKQLRRKNLLFNKPKSFSKSKLWKNLRRMKSLPVKISITRKGNSKAIFKELRNMHQNSNRY